MILPIRIMCLCDGRSISWYLIIVFNQLMEPHSPVSTTSAVIYQVVVLQVSISIVILNGSKIFHYIIVHLKLAQLTSYVNDNNSTCDHPTFYFFSCLIYDYYFIYILITTPTILTVLIQSIVYAFMRRFVSISAPYY